MKSKEKNEIWFLITCWILAVVGTLSLIIFCSGCYTQKAALRQRDKIERNFPSVLSDYCAKNYPAIVGEPTVKTKIDTVTKIVQRDCDSLAEMIAAKNPGIDMQALIDSLKGYKVVTHNYHTIDSVFVPTRDSAKEKVLNNRIDSMGAVIVAANLKAAKSKTRGDIFMWLFIGTGLLGALIIYLKSIL